MIIGLILVVIGGLLLLEAFGISIGSLWTIFWGLVFVVIGLKMIMKRSAGCMCCGLFHGKKDECCGHDHR